MVKVLSVLYSLSKDEASVEEHQKNFTIKISSSLLKDNTTGKYSDLPASFLCECVTSLYHLLCNVLPDDAVEFAAGDDGEQQVLVGLVVPDGRAWSHCGYWFCISARRIAWDVNQGENCVLYIVIVFDWEWVQGGEKKMRGNVTGILGASYGHPFGSWLWKARPGEALKGKVNSSHETRLTWQLQQRTSIQGTKNESTGVWWNMQDFRIVRIVARWRYYFFFTSLGCDIKYLTLYHLSVHSLFVSTRKIHREEGSFCE